MKQTQLTSIATVQLKNGSMELFHHETRHGQHLSIEFIIGNEVAHANIYLEDNWTCVGFDGIACEMPERALQMLSQAGYYTKQIGGVR